MANPRSIAMKKLREREELARQAALLGSGDNNKGVMSNLGSIGQIVSDDSNDLDNLSFSTTDGLNASFKNNRAKDSSPTTFLKENFSSNFIHPRNAAMALMRENQAMQKENTRAANARDNAKRFSALNSFIETNSAEPKVYQGSPRGNPEIINTRNENLALANENFQQIQLEEEERNKYNIENRKRYEELKLLFPNQRLTSKYYPDHDYSSEATFDQLNRVESSITETGYADIDTTTLMGLDDSLILADMDKRAQEKEADRLYKNQINNPNPDDIAQPMTVADYDRLLAEQEDFVDPENVDVYGQTTTQPLFQLYTDTANNIPGTNFTEQNRIADEKLFKIAEEEALRQSLRQPEEQIIESSSLPSSLSLNIDDLLNQDSSEINVTREIAEEITSEDYVPEEAIEDLDSFDEISMTNTSQSLDGSNYDELLEQQRITEGMDDTADIEQGMVDNRLSSGMDDSADIELGLNNNQQPVQSLDGSNEDELLTTEVAKVQEDAVVAESAKVLNANEETRAVKQQADAIIDGDDDDKTKESKLAGLFGSLKDIFGVDNKSLLRAFIKYVGGRAFGMSSGKAAQFAWAGIEADMATNTAAGADAKTYKANMAEYDKQYQAALDSGNDEEASRILRKMRSESGVEVSDAEKFDDNISYLNDKYREASQAAMSDGSVGDKVKMAQIQRQLKAMEAAGISGAKGNTWMGSLNMTGPDGVSVVAQAMQQEGQPLKYFDEVNNKWKLPSEDGFSNAIRTTTSDSSTKFGAADMREYTEEDLLANDGKGYVKNIPGASQVTISGVPIIPEENSSMSDKSGMAKNSVKSLMHMWDLIEDPRVREEVFSLQEKFFEDMGRKADEGPIRAAFSTFISQEGSPVAKIWFNNLNTLITGKLRRETGAAYNKEELVNTMKFFPDASLMPYNYDELLDTEKDKYDKGITARMLSAQQWILTDMEAFNAYPYVEGLVTGVYKPDNLWIATRDANREVINASYVSKDANDFIRNNVN